jgi:hypothetical protein
MRKIFFICCIFFSATLPVFSQSDQTESLTINTYYPSPYGSYNRLQTKRMAVGDRNNDGKLTDADLPLNDGQLYIGRSVIYQPLNSLPASGTPGELAYNASAGAFYYYTASGNWAPLGNSAPGMYVTYNGSCLAGYTKKGSLGTWGKCFTSSPVTDSFMRPAGGACSGVPGTWVEQDFTEAFVCGGSAGGCYVSYSGSCLAGFTNQGSLGKWGTCCYKHPLNPTCAWSHMFRPPGGGCPVAGPYPWFQYNISTAVACCQ